ncbi:MAG TPA: hypothetical protein DCZ94_00300 [Lentisphaeria bacterium]|nr:MAG: hypothetical protein A2X48_18795 [Lentisphaerae bacterium GWF2_49_21]HBC85372.1 hypothetical protein [Lentisphaeria bacterium]
MPDIQRTWIAVPVFNHSAKLASLVDEILKACPNLVVVDDGSTDTDIGKVLSGKAVELVSHRKNMGKGEAIKTAAQFIIGRNGDYMITIDADGQHYPGEIKSFLEAIRHTEEKIILGARNFNSPKIPLSSRTGRKLSNWFVRIETGRKLNDTQSGFRAYPVSLFNKVSCRSSGFSFETEIIVRAIWSRYDVSEINISVHYPGSRDRISHFGFFKDNIRIFLLHMSLLHEKFMRIIRR